MLPSNFVPVLDLAPHFDCVLLALGPVFLSPLIGTNTRFEQENL